MANVPGPKGTKQAGAGASGALAAAPDMALTISTPFLSVKQTDGNTVEVNLLNANLADMLKAAAIILSHPRAQVDAPHQALPAALHQPLLKGQALPESALTEVGKLRGEYVEPEASGREEISNGSGVSIGAGKLSRDRATRKWGIQCGETPGTFRGSPRLLFELMAAVTADFAMEDGELASLFRPWVLLRSPDAWQGTDLKAGEPQIPSKLGPPVELVRMLPVAERLVNLVSALSTPPAQIATVLPMAKVAAETLVNALRSMGIEPGEELAASPAAAVTPAAAPIQGNVIAIPDGMSRERAEALLAFEATPAELQALLAHAREVIASAEEKAAQAVERAVTQAGELLAEAHVRTRAAAAADAAALRP